MYDVLIDRLDHQGRGIGYIDGKIVFVKNALPGESVRVKVVRENKKFYEAVVFEYYSKSDERVKVNCPYYEFCGGCDIMHMNYDFQHNYKVNKVKDIIRKFVKDDINVVDISYDSQFNYRNKATFHVKAGIGYYKEKTYDLIDVDKCMISSSEINNTLSILKKMDLSGVDKVIVRSSYYDKSVMVIFECCGKVNENVLIESLKENVSSIYIKRDGYKLIYGSEYIIDKIGDLRFVISPDSFFQVNTPMAYKLYSKVLEYAGNLSDSNVLDLYCGTGTIGLFVGGKSLVGIEINESAIHDANINKDLNGVSARFICGDSGKELKKLDKSFDVVIVDPPRSGLSELSINEVISVGAKRVIYVSCDPVTLARDLNIFKEYYDVREISLFDLFPNTHHIEVVCCLSLR
jgi:23S rRNA (uracil1939-C5)-methyltransferase